MNNKAQRKILIFAIIFLFLLTFAFTLMFLITSLNKKTSGTSNETSSDEEVIQLHDSLLEFANNQIDDELGLNKKEEQYDVDKLASFDIIENILSYSSYNDNYVFTIKMEINDITNIQKCITSHLYANVEIYQKDIVKTEINPLLTDEDFKTNINGNNYISVLNKPNDQYRHIDMSYLGKDNKYYSLVAWNYKFDEFSIEGVEEKLFSISEENALYYNLLKMMII